MKTIIKRNNHLTTSKTVNLNISIFYNANNYHSALLNGIKPFINNTKKITSFYLMLSTERGSHIRLALETKKSNAELLAKQVDFYFKNFLERNPSKAILKKKQSFWPFLDFENNTIHYGIFDLIHINQNSLFHRLYFKNLNVLVLEVFKCYGSETEKALPEIMIQLFNIFSITANLNKKNTISLFQKLIQEEFLKYDTKSKEIILEENKVNFEKNKIPVVAYLQNSRKNIVINYDEYWEVVWKQNIIEVLNSLSKKKQKSEITSNYLFMIKTVCYVFSFQRRLWSYHLFMNALKLI